MAERGSLPVISFKKQSDDLITCSVCLNQYTNPKTLPCHHSFCVHCIKLPMEIKDGKYYTSCPTCHVDHLLPEGGANCLPNDFRINSLLNLQKFVTRRIPTPYQSICPRHNGLLTIYCETCCQVICQNCTIHSTGHNEHTFYLISEYYLKRNQQIQDNLDLVKHKLDDMNTAMTHLDTREKEVIEQGENIKEQINTHATQLIIVDNIQQSRTNLTQQVDTIVKLKRQTLATQRQQAQKLHTQLKTCQDTIENSLKEWQNQQQILAWKITMMDEMKTAIQHVDPAVFQPMEDANIRYFRTEKEIGYIIAYSKATLEVSTPCSAEKPSTATLTLYSTDGSPFSLPPSLISSTLSSPGDEHCEKCPITQTQAGKYNITFAPSTGGNHQLIVQVGGVNVPDSPFTLPVIPTPEMRGEPVKIITGLNQPRGIAVCDNGDIVVAENGADCITIFNRKGKKVKTFRQFNDPFGVAISIDGHILVTDKNQLQKLTTDGVCVKSVGSTSERGHPRFMSLGGIAVHPTTGQIFVVDYLILVYSNDLTYSHVITSSTCLSENWFPLFHGQPCQVQRFNLPHDIAIDDEGYLYIVCSNRSGILKVSSSDGRHIESFDHQTVIHPSYLTVHNNLVYVCVCEEKSIMVFDTDGKLQCWFNLHLRAENILGMATDSAGNLYVCDPDNNRIVVF